MVNYTMERWNINKSSDLYGVSEWGGGYFFIAENGDMMVMPEPGAVDRGVSIAAISNGIRERGFDMPVLLRIENILDAQITSLNETFRSAMEELGYTSTFMGAYPIKVNQQKQVVEKITQFGSRYHHGLEAGSKAELIAAMGMMRDKKAVLICNGYKDEEFIDLGLYATKIGFTCILVVEMPDELPLIIERSKALNAKPILGIRIKLSAQAGGHWSESGGERSIFGLNTSQIIQAVDLLASAGMLDCLKLVHYHLGSQISNIREIRTAVNEACRVYAGLVKEGRQGRIPRPRRRPGGGLRRLAVQFSLQPQLHPQGVLHRHHRGGDDLAGGREHRPSDHHYRIGPGAGGLLFDPAVQHPRRHPVPHRTPAGATARGLPAPARIHASRPSRT